MSKRTDILARVVTDLLAVKYDDDDTSGFLKYAIEVDRKAITDLDKLPTPYALVSLLSETNSGDESGGIGRESWTASLIISITARGLDMETVLEQVNTAMYADKSLNGNIDYLKRANTIHINEDPSDIEKTLQITYELTYSTAVGGC